MADRGEPMGDDESGAALRRLGQRELQLLLGGGVERGGGFVENHDRRVFEQRPRNRESLALAARQETSALADISLQGIGLTCHEIAGLREVERMGDFRLAGVGFADGEILLDRAGKQHRLLKHHADVPA